MCVAAKGNVWEKELEDRKRDQQRYKRERKQSQHRQVEGFGLCIPDNIFIYFLPSPFLSVYLVICFQSVCLCVCVCFTHHARPSLCIWLCQFVLVSPRSPICHLSDRAALWALIDWPTQLSFFLSVTVPAQAHSPAFPYKDRFLYFMSVLHPPHPTPLPLNPPPYHRTPRPTHLSPRLALLILANISPMFPSWVLIDGTNHSQGWFLCSDEQLPKWKAGV